MRIKDRGGRDASTKKRGSVGRVRETSRWDSDGLRMTGEDIVRRLSALRKLSQDRGAFPVEGECTKGLMRLLQERYAVEDAGFEPEPEPQPALDWFYWSQILSEVGIEGNRFLKSASADLDSTKILIIKFDGGEWEILRKTPSGYQTIVRNCNPESLPVFLHDNSPRKYTFAQVSSL